MRSRPDLGFNICTGIFNIRSGSDTPIVVSKIRFVVRQKEELKETKSLLTKEWPLL